MSSAVQALISRCLGIDTCIRPHRQTSCSAPALTKIHSAFRARAARRIRFSRSDLFTASLGYLSCRALATEVDRGGGLVGPILGIRAVRPIPPVADLTGTGAVRRSRSHGSRYGSPGPPRFQSHLPVELGRRAPVSGNSQPPWYQLGRTPLCHARDALRLALDRCMCPNGLVACTRICIVS